MQNRIVEYSANFVSQCLPAVLRTAGYRTGFFQSARGIFEQRPRLAANMGYEDFAAWEDIQGEELGYLASDDESLVAPIANWIDRQPSDQPFFITALTSAAHHPYRLSTRARARAEKSGAPVETDEDRYARLVEAEDELLGALLEIVETRALRDRTIFVVAGDHGEGFGDKGVKQHDNNFYQEGLRVPVVFAGPGVPKAEID